MFEACTLIVILANTAVLAMEDPKATTQSPFLIMLDDVFLALYTIEMVFKIVGLGFICGPKTYLKDAWNILDFIIVVSAYFSMMMSGSSVNLSALRSFRVLRPLKTISGI